MVETLHSSQGRFPCLARKKRETSQGWGFEVGVSVVVAVGSIECLAGRAMGVVGEALDLFIPQPADQEEHSFTKMAVM